eukprot:TRINITY_DN1008_c0_g1_i1.p1 TRINITY_DN1008_c0_g1~~TRINITY_DN1008_c0_g1_i1.p1  ORF type:complete len:552 (-),score=163.02 TRINITY_DN1008_c0_g1_i1:62-1717(-)
MERLVPLVAKLQEVLGIVGKLHLGQAVDLPQIVVVGSQSAGKSSVLENLVGHDFLPRGSNIVTRRPLVLHLFTHEEEYAEFGHMPDKRFLDFGQVLKEIEAETERVCGPSKGISPHPILLKIYSPKVLNLAMVDLPGITKVAVGDQPKDIELQIRKMIMTYIQRPSAMILALTAANTDLANSDAIKLAREVDPEGVRTIGVVTKLDLMDEGTHAGDILQNRTIPLRLGYVGVINRSQKDIDAKKTITEHLKSEEKFIGAHSVYTQLKNVGTPQLGRFLNRELLRHIAQVLPDLKQRVTSQRDRVTSELEGMGDWKNHNSDNRGRVLLQVLNKFCNAFNDMVEGRQHGADLITGGARINWIFTEVFKPAVEGMNPLLGMSDDELRMAMKNSTGVGTYLFTPEITFEMLVTKQLQALEAPALQAAELVHNELLTVTQECSILDVKNFKNLPDKLLGTVKSLLIRNMQNTTKMIADLIKIELAFVNVDHPDFRKALDSYQPPAEGPQSGGNAGGDFFSKFFGSKKKEDGQQIGGRTVQAAEWKERDRQGVDMIK